MADFNFIHNYIFQNCDQAKCNGNHFHCRCPICLDSKKSKRKKRFHLTYLGDGKTKAHCFNCDWSGTFEGVYAHIEGISIYEAYKILSKEDFNVIKSKLYKNGNSEKEEIPEKNNFNYILNDLLGEDAITCSIVYRKYLDELKKFRKNRKIPDHIKLYIATRGKYNGRIVIPVFENGNIVYFQARSLSDRIKPKYLNPASEKQIIVPNIEKFDSNELIIVTEGLIDSFMLGNNGTCCLGKSINDDFLEKCISCTSKGVIIALDNDEDGKKEILKYMINGYFANQLLYFIMPYKNIKDLNELCIEHPEINDIFLFVKNNSFTLLKAKTLLSLL
ncbi:MAG: hypothetical protein ACOC56_01050 [Atribacterota bacterium]